MSGEDQAPETTTEALVNLLAEVVTEQMALIRQQHADLVEIVSWQRALLTRYYEAGAHPPTVWQEGKR